MADVHQLGYEARAGLHAGEVELLGDDIAGIAAHIAARVMAHAGPGEVVVSRTIKDLVVGSGLQFEDRGTRPLKGVPERWQLFAVENEAVRDRTIGLAYSERITTTFDTRTSTRTEYAGIAGSVRRLLTGEPSGNARRNISEHVIGSGNNVGSALPVRRAATRERWKHAPP